MSHLPNLIPLRRKGDLPCPECANLMTPYKCEHVVVNLCHACKGIWFDRKEIGVLRNALARFDYSELQIEDPSPGLVAYPIFGCPRCREVLVEATYGYNSGVKVHTCVLCKGLWVPLHEVVNLIALAKVGQAIAPDVKGTLSALKEIDAENRRFLWLRDFAQWLMSARLPWW